MRLSHRACPILLFGLLGALLLGIAVFRPIDHDEGQYVAAVALMRTGLPYRDFAYLQTPLQPLLFAPLAWWCEGWLFLALRIANVLCAAGAAALMYRGVRGLGGSPRSGWLAVLALVTTHAFLFAATVARNDALPLLLHMAGLVLLLDALGKHRRAALFLLAGLALGAAASAKVSYGLPAVAVGLFALLHVRQLGLPCILALGAGGIVGGAPTLILLAMAPEAAWFGIVDYSLKAPMEWQMLNQRAYMAQAPLSLLRLLRFLLQGSALLALVACAMSVLRRSGPLTLTDRLLGSVVIAGLIAAWLPRPIYVQYLVPLLPALFLRFGAMLDDPRWSRPAILLGLAVFSLAGATETLIRVAPPIVSGHSPVLSATQQAHMIGHRVRAAGLTGRIVSLAPEQVVDSFIPLDPRFAAGPFLFRTRALLSAEQRSAFHVVNGASAAAALTRDPPAAILVGPESAASPAHPHGLDASLVAWAIAHDYRAVPLRSAGSRLYLRQD